MPGLDGIQPMPPRWSGGHSPYSYSFFIFILHSPPCFKSYLLFACVIRSNHPTYRMFYQSNFSYLNILSSGVARSQATGALAWGVETNLVVTVAFFTLFYTV
jgi:hypothetical protein